MLVEGAERVDLDGFPSGSVSADEAANATARIAWLRRRAKERRDAARAAPKPEPAKSIEARQRPSAHSGVITRAQAKTAASGRPVITLGNWRGAS